MRKPFIAGNWKMHKTIDEAVDLVKMLRAELDGVNGCDMAVCPPSLALAAVREALAGSTIGLGAQNMYWEEKGAFTGEVSPVMLAGLCDHVIIGHSERRNVFGESDKWVNKKLHAAFAYGLRPILCVGENLQQNQAWETVEFVGGQVRAAFAGITTEQARITTVAYEPIWAIGTGRAATPVDANRVAALSIRGPLAERFGEPVAQAVRVQYGGSVTVANIDATTTSRDTCTS